MSEVRIPTSLRNAPSAPTSAEELEALRAKAWREHGRISMHIDEFTDDFVRQGVINEVTKRFGKRFRG